MENKNIKQGYNLNEIEYKRIMYMNWISDKQKFEQYFNTELDYKIFL